MFCSRSWNNLINRIHERALRLIHNRHVGTFLGILEMIMEKTIHQNNLESHAKKLYKFLNGLSPPIINGAFMIRNNKYNLTNFQCLQSTNKRAVKYGTETVREPTIPDKIFGTKSNNPVKLDRRRKVWYLFLCVF